LKFIIKHEIRGRMRVHLNQPKMTFSEADTLEYYLTALEQVVQVKVHEVTADAVIEFVGERDNIIRALSSFHYEEVIVPENVLENSGRELSAIYKQKMIMQVASHYLGRIILPMPIRSGLAIIRSIPFILQGIQCIRKMKIEVPLLDAIAISVSLLRRDFKTASSVMFLLGVGETMEEWTHKKSVGDLARSMALNVGKVWQVKDDSEVLVSANQIVPGDCIKVCIGNMIPFDGDVVEGEAMVNQASLTGESLPVTKAKDSYVYAGTVVEEGEIIISVRKSAGGTHYEQIVQMIENSEKLKSKVESKAEHLADRLVPYTLAGTVATWLLTRNVLKTMSVLMVDFSCALKLSMPITVLSAIRDAGNHNITVKGGKFLEAMAEATTIVFDKTGTITKAKPTVREILPYTNEYTKEEILRVAACLEEHFPHSMANAVVEAAKEQGLEHEEMHSKVEYIVAHGIASHIGEKRVLIGSHHFIVEDEKCSVAPEFRPLYDKRPLDCSHLYMAVDGVLIAIICIEDSIREEAREVISKLREEGFKKIIMMTGDSRRTANVIAEEIGVDECYAEVLPEDKAAFVTKEKEKGHKVVMVGDGINDSPALSAADVGIAISDGAAIAREIADVTITADDLHELIKLRQLSSEMMQRIQGNYRKILLINGVLIGLGVTGIISPTTSAVVHNASTVAISVSNMKPILV